MRVWLDDIRSMPEGYDLHVRTAWEAKQALVTRRVTHISLDHDLALEHYHTDLDKQLAEETGYDVACWIEEAARNAGLPPLTWAVHSQNPVGAERIRAAMERAERYWSLTPIEEPGAADEGVEGAEPDGQPDGGASRAATGRL